DLLAESRLQKLRHLSTADTQLFVKREDESGFLVSGTKRRKYASLIPYLRKHAIRRVGLIGGEHSNHLPAILQ
ncbi:MAG: 1-aminocyclopropane-1-carboxylate deaminase, partial [Bacteroidota bacterium]